MTSIALNDLFTHLYVLVDDCYKTEGYKLMTGKVGRKPKLSDSEILTLILAHDFVPFPSETQHVAFIRANYLALFPQLVDQSQYTRRARGPVCVKGFETTSVKRLRQIRYEFRRIDVVVTRSRLDNSGFPLTGRPIHPRLRSS